MQGDITLPPPVPPPNKPDRPKPAAASSEVPPQAPSHDSPEAAPQKAERAPLLKRWRLIAGAGVIILVIAVALVAWAFLQLQPRDSQATMRRQVVIARGSTPAEIAQILEQDKIIRNAFIFRLYVILKGEGPALKAGTYALSPSQSVHDIVAHLKEGKVDTLRITIAPGQTLKQLQAALIKYGFDQNEVSEALNGQYTHPLLASRPAGASLEGYIFPDTYEIEASDTVSALLTKTFDTMQERIEQAGITPAIQGRNLNIHQAVTLASIVQKEDKRPEEQRRIAQVFLRRLSVGMPLGSDVTFFYASDLLGVAPSVDVDSPYNTRKYPGLPPGPIGNFTMTALEAVAHPAEGDYLYFVAGDDGVNYFARTLEEHERNIKAHCSTLCQ